MIIKAKTALCFLALLVWFVLDWIRERHEGSRRQAAVQRARGWWKAIRRAYRYKAEHRARRNRKQSKPDREPERYTGKRRITDAIRPRSHRRRFFKDYTPAPACRDIRTADGLICIPTGQTASGRFVRPPNLPLQHVRPPVPVDPWQEYITRQHRNNTLTLHGQEGPHQYVSNTASVMGRNPDTASQDISTDEFVRTVKGWGDHHGTGGTAHRGGRVQRTPERLQAQLESLFDLVSESIPTASRGGRRTFARVRRLPLTARRSQRAVAQ